MKDEMRHLTAKCRELSEFINTLMKEVAIRDEKIKALEKKQA